MPPGRASKNNILAGLFVLVSVVLGVAVLIVLSNLGDRIQGKAKYVVRFSLADGADGLERGSIVKVGGKRVGRVLGTAFASDVPGGPPTAIDVEFDVLDTVKLFEDADVQIVKPLLGTNSALNIVSLGKSTSVALPPGGRITGRLAGPGFLSGGDYARIQSIIARVDQIAADIQPQVKPIMDDARATVANARSISDDARTRWTTWSEQVGAFLARIDKAGERIQPFVDNAEKTAQDARDFLARARATVDDNRKSVDEIVENVRQLTRKANEEGYDRFMATVDSAREGVESARRSLTEAEKFLARNIPVVEDVLADAALASQQLKLTTVEVRAAPWRLLYQPNKKELENELLYNSVRTYSASVTELRVAADRLKAASEASARTGAGEGFSPGVDRGEIDRLTEKLKGAFDRYQAEEQRFLERWVKSDK
jgi:ABC-type transporter Mla subunit MlaD